jgi:ribosome-associated translation inhibitor RaiA
MNPTVLFHTEGFHARDHLAALVERKAQKLFRHQAAIVRLRIRVVRDTPHGRDENFAATGKVERAGVDFAAHAQATEPEAAIIELMQNLERQLTEHASATQSARRTLPVEGENPALAEP